MMSLPRRISAGGIIFRGNSILLLRYRGGRGGETYLVSPGGGVEDEEDIVQAVVREIREETGLTVAPGRVIAIEDLESPRVKMVKIWMLCEILEGEVRRTEGAEREGILEAAWFTKDRLEGETVFPEFLIRQDWGRLRSEAQPVLILPVRKASMEL